MVEDLVGIDTPDGVMETFAVRPGDGRYPPVILYMDAPGIRDELYAFARRIAGRGYFVLLPDLYYRLGRLRLDFSADPKEARKQAFAAMDSLSNALVMSDTEAMLGWLQKSEGAASGPRGAIGYCMSGQYVMSAAGRFPDAFAAIASLYGVGIVTEEEDSPHRLIPKMEAELYLGFAEHDPWVPETVIPTLRRDLEANGVDHILDVWPGTEHGFCFPERDAYVEAAAENVWAKVFDLYERRLVGS